MDYILSRIVFPLSFCKEEQLFFKGNYEHVDNTILIDTDNSISTCTYFNSISIKKWKKYTNLSEVFLKLKCVGNFTLNIYGAWINKKNFKKELIFSKKYELKNTTELFAPIDTTSEIAFWEIDSHSKTIIVDGAYCTTEKPQREINLAVGICTFKREEFILANIERIVKSKKYLNELGNTDIYISDNGNTLDRDLINSYDNIHITYNKNLGGASGFTRCLIESLKSKKNYTHFLFLDDDIQLNVYSLSKTLCLLSYLKQDYAEYTIGGAMFSIDDMYMQFENGARWDGLNFKFNNRHLDMRDEFNIVLNEKESDINYNAWCYCCIPYSIISSNNLPLPVFFHMDDVEYGLRNKIKIITLNGINVWHLYRRELTNPTNAYYDVRNKLIMMSELDPTKVRTILERYLNSFTNEIVKYNYASAINAFNGILDYLLGFDNFKHEDIEKTYRNLSRDNPWIKENFDYTTNYSFPNETQIKTKKALLKQLMPMSGKKDILYNNNTADAYNYKTICIHAPKYNLCKIYSKNLQKIAYCLMLRLKILLKLKTMDFNEIVTEYKNRITEVETLHNWEKLLQLDKEKSTYNLLLVASDNDYTSGAFRSMVTLSNILTKYDVNVLVVLPSDGSGTTLLKENNIRYTVIRSEDWIIRMNSTSGTIRKKKKSMNINKVAIEKIKSLINEEHIDIVHINTSYSYVAAKAALSCNIPFIWHIREFLEEDQKRMMIDKKTGYNLMNEANTVITVSDSLLEKYKPIITNTVIKRVYNGIDSNVFYNTAHNILTNEIIKIGCVGVLSEYKGQHILVESFVNLKNEGYSNIEIHLAGSTSEKLYVDKINETINNNNAHKNVYILGKISDMKTFYSNMDIIVICAQSEAFGRTTIEAMMSGCLVIGANTAGTKELIKDMYDGYLFDINNPASLSNIIKKVIFDRNTAITIAQRGQNKAINEYTAENNALNIMNVHKNILGVQ